MYLGKNIEFPLHFILIPPCFYSIIPPCFSISCSLAGTVVLALFQVLPIVQLITYSMCSYWKHSQTGKWKRAGNDTRVVQCFSLVYKPPPSFNLPTNSTTRYSLRPFAYVWGTFGCLATMCVPWEAIISQAISLQVANQTSENFIAYLLLSTFILIMNESGTFCYFLTVRWSLVTDHSEGSI